jgi:hypothetical protein
MSSTASLSTVRGIEREAIGAAPAAIVAGDVELFEAELLHDRELVARHGALRIGLVVGARGGFAAAAVAAQVGADDGVVFGEARRDLRPHRVGLGKPWQEQRGTRPAVSQADGDFVGLDCC